MTDHDPAVQRKLLLGKEVLELVISNLINKTVCIKFSPYNSGIIYQYKLIFLTKIHTYLSDAIQKDTGQSYEDVHYKCNDHYAHYI